MRFRNADDLGATVRIMDMERSKLPVMQANLSQHAAASRQKPQPEDRLDG